MTQARAGLSVRKLTADEVRGRGGTVAPQKTKYDFSEAEPEAYGGGAYGTVGHIGVVVAPERAYLAVDTVGSPRTSEDFRAAAEALYAAAYGVKVRNKALDRRGTPGADDADRSDFRMPPLERLRGEVAPHDTDTARWTLLLRRPAWIDEAEVGDVLEQLEVSKGLSLARVRCLDLPAASYLQTRVDGRWSAALLPTAKAFAVQLREQSLAAVDGAWHEVCLGEPGAPVGENSYLLRLRLA
ncbi:hypothetical protein HWD35_13285 [Tsukamurella tyrosinosolvens]|uniref:hypothetical protein n=1 Tax=Tsukamurella tyrosinosolvens TaxID=57704 RepID=UPI0007958F85|nr:hypothetical protein [Tsukamurella tyrosinosolvens]KXP04457.1 hypothetical protein AXK59_13620 [Tsukamurella tyrosinosolvens]KZL97696.1 hypothetical protein AXX05_01740 [Tsukamurella tyrosinosolvens]MCA4995684.1 hypothetical protein [Tsukamurella tyrosinosolvens]WEL91953.1 hypothetical protein P1N98_12210 [Tsukamurella tyrosinosolvens]